MLPTKLIKKGCIISFISLLLLAAVLYFVVYKTLVLESFEDEDEREAPSTREWGRTVLDAGQMSGVGGDDGNRPAFEAALKFGKESITGLECGQGSKTDIQEKTCTSIVNEDECNTMMRVKKKYKGRGEYDDKTDFKAFEDAGLTGNGVGYDLNQISTDVDYRLNYNVYPCKWVSPSRDAYYDGIGECTNDLHNRCVFMGEENWNADDEKTNNDEDASHSYTYSDIREAIRCAPDPTPPGCPVNNGV